MAGRFYLWTDDDEDESLAPILRAPHDLVEHPKEHLLHAGVKVADLFPALTFDLEDGPGVKMGDHIPNALGLLLVSERLKAVLEARADAEIEYIPIAVRDRNKRPSRKRYFIANVLGELDCMDRGRSDLDVSDIDPDVADRIRTLVLDPAKIGVDVKLFRLKGAHHLFLVREDLCHEILDAGMTGIFFLDPDEYGKEWRE
jgi:hypothetical protein